MGSKKAGDVQPGDKVKVDGEKFTVTNVDRRDESTTNIRLRGKGVVMQRDFDDQEDM